MTGETTGRSEPVTVAADLNGKVPRSSLVELKNGKVVLKQKCPPFEKLSETLQEIVKFREMLALRIERGDPPLLSIPDEHRPVIAKLAHESDKTLPALTKHIHKELLPQDDTEEDILSSGSSSLPFQVVEAAIKSIGIRNNYGLDGTGTGKVPAAVCVWRWEVKEEHRHWLPKNAREKAEVRLAERVQAKKDLFALFESLTQDEQDAILGPKGGSKFPSRDKRAGIMPNTSVVDLTEESKAASPQSTKGQQQQLDEENDAHFPDPCGKINPLKAMKISVDPVKYAKEKENLGKKASKGKKEKKEKQGDFNSRSLMNFFGKAKSNYRSSPAQETPDVATLSSSSRSEFDKTFKPFLLKKDAELAPINWFVAKGGGKGWSGSTVTDAIRVDGVDDKTSNKRDKIPDDHDIDSSFDYMIARERLIAILSSLPSSPNPPRHSRSIYSPHLGHRHPPAVREIISRLTEAEIAGDISLVRSLLSRLSDRTIFTPKVFFFAEDSRPGYFGTWTRKSANIGPRSPFKRDPVVIDYGYDSGEEWEDEGAGEADDVVEDGDEDGETEDPDSDLDSWLVDDDDDLPDVGIASEERNTPPLPSNLPPPPKRKLKDEDQKLGKKRKIVVPLVPFVKGPYWESAVGHCEYDIFRAYQIRLFNDTPFPINPFTFVSAAVQDQRLDTVFAVPTLPDRLLTSKASSAIAVPDPSIPRSSIPFIQVDPSPTSAVVRRTVSSPKTSFPDAHLPLLLAKITSLQTGNFTFLVESIYQELRGLNVKKNAIEAKIKEVAEKSKERKLWSVKQDAMSHMQA